MKKDLKRKSSKKNSSHSKWRWVLIGSASIICCMVILVADLYREHSLISTFIPSNVSLYVEQMKSWIAERRNHLHKNLEKVKQVAVRKGDPSPPIHFEFYTALPNMQVPIPESAKSEESVVAAANQSHKITPPIKKPSVNVANTTIFDADRLQRAFKEELNQNQYVIQLGIFKKASTAERFKLSLNQSGVSANLVHVTLAGDKAFCVQLGPYETKDQAKLMQHRLQQKKINGIVRLQESITP